MLCARVTKLKLHAITEITTHKEEKATKLTALILNLKPKTKYSTKLIN